MIDRIRAAIVFGKDKTGLAVHFLEPGDTEWIQMASFCEMYHCLPRPGGYWDQDPVEVQILMAVQAAYAERRELRADKRQGTIPDHPRQG